jgi:hypothetical protein
MGPVTRWEIQYYPSIGGKRDTWILDGKSSIIRVLAGKGTRWEIQYKSIGGKRDTWGLDGKSSIIRDRALAGKEARGDQMGKII